MSQTDNMDMSKLMGMLAKMDKRQLEEGLSKVNELLNSKDKDKILGELQKNYGNNNKQ